MKKIRHILVPVDGSDHSDKSVDMAIGLAQDCQAKLSFLYVEDVKGIPLDAYVSEEMMMASRLRGREVLAAARDKTPAGVAAAVYEENGDPAGVILDFSEMHNVDMIVMGRRGLGAIRSAILGSVSQQVIHHAKCSVLISK